MDKEEYKLAIKEINDWRDKKIGEISKKYAMDNNNVKVGDIIIDHIGPLKVGSISISVMFGSRFPECVYKGTRLTKKMKPRVHNSHGSIYQSNIKEHIVSVD